MRGLKWKYACLLLCSFLVCVTPPVLAFLLHRWTYTVGDAEGMFRVCAGLLALCVPVLRQLIGNRPMSHLTVAVWVFLISVLLPSAGTELPLLCAAWLLGRALYTVFFETAFLRIKRRVGEESHKG